jgi:hypothetical protein
MRSWGAIARWGRCWAAITRRSSAIWRQPVRRASSRLRCSARVTDDFAGLIAGRVEQTGGRVTARRLMRIMRAAGYGGSERSLRRALAEAKAAWRAKQALQGRVYRPWVSEPGEWMLCDWGAAGDNPHAGRSAQAVVLLLGVGLVALSDGELLLLRAFRCARLAARRFAQTPAPPGKR